MKTKLVCLLLGLVGTAVLMCVGLTNISPGAGAVQADETKTAAPQVVLAETYNAVTRIYFTNIAGAQGLAQTRSRRTAISGRCQVLAHGRQVLRPW